MEKIQRYQIILKRFEIWQKLKPLHLENYVWPPASWSWASFICSVIPICSKECLCCHISDRVLLEIVIYKQVQKITLCERWPFYFQGKRDSIWPWFVEIHLIIHIKQIPFAYWMKTRTQIRIWSFKLVLFWFQ